MSQRTEVAVASSPPFGPVERVEVLQNQLSDVQGQLDLANSALDRANRIIKFSSRYRVDADLAASIHDVALAEGIEPDLAFRLVKVESNFRDAVISPAGAVGLTQVMPSTARYFDKEITVDKLKDRHTNLRIGLRYLRILIDDYKGDFQMALVAYNRGPGAVAAAKREGLDPRNGYERVVLRGYTGSGTVE